MHFSWHNISPKYNNNEIEYKVGGGEYKTITFASGSYGYDDISYYTKQRSIDEGDFKEEDDNDEPPIYVHCNLGPIRLSLAKITKLI